MASVTQKIGNYVLGMSTQPDERKIGGQVVDLKNGLPDVVRQLEKRPGTSLVKDITTTSNPYGDSKTYAVDTGSHSKWFNIYTSAEEQYIGQVTNAGVVNVWRCSDGASIPVDYSSVTGTNKADYLDNSGLSDEKSSDIQVMTINETTFFCNRRKNTAMKTTPSFLSPPLVNEAYIELDNISYGKQYALDIYDPTSNTTYTHTRATGIVVDETISYSGSSNGDCQGMGRETVNVSTGTAIWSTSPPNASSGGKSNLRYEMDTRCTPQPTDDSDADNYHDSYQPYAKLQFGGEGWTTNDTHQYTSQKGVTTTVTIKSHVNVISRANIAMVRPAPTSSNAEEHVSSGGVLGDIKTALDAISGTGITATIVGNGIHLYRATPFGVTTPERTLMNVITSEANNIADLPRTCRHGYTVRIVNSGEDMDDYYLKFQAEGIAAEIAQTGTYARSGNTITITANGHGLENGDQVIASFTSGAATDGYYTIANKTTNTFEVTDSASGTISAGETVYFQPARFGEGVWEEVCEPGIQIQFDNDTMPLSLTRVLPGTYAINGGSSRNYTNGTFKFQYPDWGKRDVGDDITNAPPSFVGYPIQKMLFFRNRIALLSAENVILSRVNDFYNFWVKTAMAISNADPIDLQSSSTYPTKLFDAVETNTGLVIYSASEQFLLSSGAEALLTPETAKISFLASYAFNPDTNPISLGTTIGWINSTAKNARFYEMAGANTREEPQIQEQSKIVAELFPTNITLMDASPENSLLLFGTDSTLHTATKEVWGYKFHQTDKGRNQSAFFRWTFPNNIIYQCILDDKFYLVLNNGSKYTLEKLDIKLRSDTDLIGDEPDVNRVYLDTKKTVASGDLTYNTAADTTTFTLGSGYYSSNTLTAYCVTSSDARGKSYDIKSADITGTAPNETVTLPGNWKTSTEAGPGTSSVNTDLIIGYEYEFEVELPKIYLTRQEGESSKAETRGSLVLHRMNFDFGDVGVIDVTLKRKGRSDYTYTVESLEWDNINASEPAIADGYMHTIPVYDRNINTTVILKSNHPSPSTLNSMNWEGDYSPRYYRRV
tara:strand:+ start:27 stop:3200 length:3174 start_codon:yes stop_codon:yes gene_type:complete